MKHNGTINEAFMDYANDNSEPFILEKGKKHHDRPRFQFPTFQNAQAAQTKDTPQKPGFQFTKKRGWWIGKFVPLECLLGSTNRK